MEEPRVVPFAAYEAQSERNVRTIKHMSIGWAVSVITLAMLCLVSTAYTSEVVTETTAEVQQEASYDGSNIYAEGNVNGAADDTENASNDSQG